MIRVTRDRAKLGDTPFISFMVYEDRPNFPNAAEATLCGTYSFRDPVLGCGSSQFRFPGGFPVKHAFVEACCVAVDKGFSAILIIDHKQQFDVEPWVRQGLIDYFDDHS
jgi:hypothetical protein